MNIKKRIKELIILLPNRAIVGSETASLIKKYAPEIILEDFSSAETLYNKTEPLEVHTWDTRTNPLKDIQKIKNKIINQYKTFHK